MPPHPKQKPLNLEQFKYSDTEVALIGCMVCLKFDKTYTHACIHHVRKLITSKKRKDAPRLPLCPVHHQNHEIGISLHDGEKTFQTIYGNIETLLNELDELLIKDYGMR